MPLADRRGVPRRVAELAVLVLLGLLGRAAAAEPAALAVRPADAPAGRAAMARLAQALAVLPVPPQDARAVLAAGAPAHVTSKATLSAALDRAATAPGPGLAHPLGGWLVLRFAAAADRDAALDVLARPGSGFVAEPVRDIAIASEAADAAALHSPQIASPEQEIPDNVRQVRAPEALAAVQPDSSIVVAIVDTGVDLEHPDLVRRLWRNDDPPGNASTADDGVDQNGDGVVETWEQDDDDNNGYVDDLHGFDFTDAPGKGGFGDAVDRDPDPSDDEGHGTHVAGIVAADGSLRGVAPFVQILPVRAAYTTLFGGVLESDDAAAAIVYAVDNGARILNLSWGDREESRLVREAVAYALEHGAVVVAAAGNGGTDLPHWPSGQPGVLGVGAVDATNQRASFSNFGPGIAIYAPGERDASIGGGIVSLAPGGGRATRRGTSMAAPHVAGAAAILMSRPDRPDAQRVRALLVAGARHDGSGEALARGVLDVLSAVQSSEDVVLEVTGPPRPFRTGRVRLLGTVTGGDLTRWRADARPLGGGATVELVPWQAARIVGGTLVDVPMAGVPEGDWEYVLAIESGRGARREVHGAFTVDYTPPALDTLFAASAWRGPEPRWWIAAAAREEVSLRVAPTPFDTLAHAGLARRVEIETAPIGSQSTWPIRLEDGAGLGRDTTVAAPPALAAWPRGGRLELRDETSEFRPESVWGVDRNGQPVVWGTGPQGPAAATIQAWGESAGRLVPRHDTGRVGRPLAFADANGDGAPDLLVQLGSDIVWLVSRGQEPFPDSVLARVPAERGLGLLQLDDDPPAEAILGSRDTLYLYDDASAGPPALLQALPNPSPSGFNVFGATAAAGDLDQDGALEIACGDAEGRVAVFERRAGRYEVERVIDSGGVYAYEIASLPDGGFVLGRQRTRDLVGDGFEIAVYAFQMFAPRSGVLEAGAELPFLAPVNDLHAACTAVRSPASGTTWLALVRGADAYLASGPATALQQEAHDGGAAGVAPALLDLDGDGQLDVVLRSDTGARWLRLDEGIRGPHDLESESRGADRLQLAWTPGDGSSSRLRRSRDGVWQILGETAGATWIDSTLVPGVTYEYEVEGVAGGLPRGVSNRIRARAQPLPRLLGAAPLSPAGVRVACSNPLRAEALDPGRWEVRGPDGAVIAVLGVSLSAAGREADLVLARAPACGDVSVAARDLRDDQGGVLAPEAAVVAARFACTPQPFAITAARIDAAAVVVEFSRAPDPATMTPARFTLEWNGTPLPVAAVSVLDAVRVRVEPGPGVVFVGRGIPYLLAVDPGVRAAGDGATLAYPGTRYAMYVAGSGAAHIFAAPNPAREQDAEVVFAEAGPDTRIEIFDLEGQRLRSLGGAAGGAVRWDLRDAHGDRVASGAYIYVARDATGTAVGRLAVLR